MQHNHAYIVLSRNVRRTIGYMESWNTSFYQYRVEKKSEMNIQYIYIYIVYHSIIGLVSLPDTRYLLFYLLSICNNLSNTI